MDELDVLQETPTMKTLALITVAASSLLLNSCESKSEYAKPLQSGIIESGLVWEHPREKMVASNTGTPIEKGSKVDIYDAVIVIHLADGTKQIEMISQVTNLRIR